METDSLPEHELPDAFEKRREIISSSTEGSGLPQSAVFSAVIYELKEDLEARVNAGYMPVDTEEAESELLARVERWGIDPRNIDEYSKASAAAAGLDAVLHSTALSDQDNAVQASRNSSQALVSRIENSTDIDRSRLLHAYVSEMRYVVGMRIVDMKEDSPASDAEAEQFAIIAVNEFGLPPYNIEALRDARDAGNQIVEVLQNNDI